MFIYVRANTAFDSRKVLKRDVFTLSLEIVFYVIANRYSLSTITFTIMMLLLLKN